MKNQFKKAAIKAASVSMSFAIAASSLPITAMAAGDSDADTAQTLTIGDSSDSSDSSSANETGEAVDEAQEAIDTALQAGQEINNVEGAQAVLGTIEVGDGDEALTGSDCVNDVVSEIEDAGEAVDEAEEEIADAEIKMDEMDSDNDRITAIADAAADAADAAVETVNGYADELRSAATKEEVAEILENAENEIAVAQDQLDALKDEIEDIEQEISALQAAYESAVNNASEDLEEAKNQLLLAESQLAALKEELSQNEGKLADAAALAINEAEKNAAADSSLTNALFESIIRNFYVPKALNGTVTAVEAVENESCVKVSYTVEGSDEASVIYVDYRTTDNGIEIYQLESENVTEEAYYYLDSVSDNHISTEDIVDTDKYIEKEGTYFAIGEKSDAESLLADNQKINGDVSCAYEFDAEGNLKENGYADVTVTTSAYYETRTGSGSGYDSQDAAKAAGNAAMAADKNKLGSGMVAAEGSVVVTEVATEKSDWVDPAGVTITVDGEIDYKVNDIIKVWDGPFSVDEYRYITKVVDKTWTENVTNKDWEFSWKKGWYQVDVVTQKTHYSYEVTYIKLNKGTVNYNFWNSNRNTATRRIKEIVENNHGVLVDVDWLDNKFFSGNYYYYQLVENKTTTYTYDYTYSYDVNQLTTTTLYNQLVSSANVESSALSYQEEKNYVVYNTGDTLLSQNGGEYREWLDGEIAKETAAQNLGTAVLSAENDVADARTSVEQIEANLDNLNAEENTQRLLLEANLEAAGRAVEEAEKRIDTAETVINTAAENQNALIDERNSRNNNNSNDDAADDSPAEEQTVVIEPNALTEDAEIVIEDAVAPLAAMPVAQAADAENPVAENPAEDNTALVTTVIADNETPLAAAAEEAAPETVQIEDEVTPLAPAVLEEAKEQASRLSWWWLLIIAVLGVTGEEIYRNNKNRRTKKADK